MRRFILITLILAFGVSFANAQEKKSQPEEKSIVNKEFDENGNLIKYDSTFVWSWSGDSTFQFEFPMNGVFSGKDFQGFGEMFADSAFAGHFSHPFFGFKQFENNEDFFRQFENQFRDTSFSKHFEFFGDSAFVFPFGSGNNFEKEFFSKDVEKMYEELHRQLGEMNIQTPRFDSEEQQKAWEDLMKKQQKEQQELMKKWKEN